MGMLRSIRVDHTNCLQVVIKTHSFISLTLDFSIHNKPDVRYVEIFIGLLWIIVLV
jgi:hypothetical protein